MLRHEIVTKLGESPFLEGFPHCNDIMFSKTRHNLAKKSPKMRRREISSNYLFKKEQPCWKTEKLPHLRISNSIYEAMAAYFA